MTVVIGSGSLGMKPRGSGARKRPSSTEPAAAVTDAETLTVATATLPATPAILGQVARGPPRAPSSWPRSPLRLHGGPLEGRLRICVTWGACRVGGLLTLVRYPLLPLGALDRGLTTAQLATRSCNSPRPTPPPSPSPLLRACTARWRRPPAAVLATRRCTARRRPHRLPHVADPWRNVLPLQPAVRRNAPAPPLRPARRNLLRCVDALGASSRRGLLPRTASVPSPSSR